ncbi:MAG: glycosyltransferase family 2 protein [Deltaproteobacteria bacterium]|nr:glycosyltransferase family 2 protein [Deltaproteobacteria bacterium]
MKICAVIPAFNNETTVCHVIRKARQNVQHIVVVDDGSTDGTARAAKNENAYVIRIPENRGKGNALRVAFRYALENGFEAVITLDADLQHDPSEIPKFVKLHETSRAGIVAGNRLNAREKIPGIRYGPNLIGCSMFSWLIGQPVPDSQCGFRLYDYQVMKNIHVLNDGFEAESDILIRAGKRGYKIVFVPVRTIYFSNHMHRSYFRPIKDTFRISIIFLMNLFWKKR